jgi:XTP/dITP diphosphohydrolase
MDRLRSPGGCPWDAAQTPTSLTPYLLEETYEVLEAIEAGDRALLREELGDLLLQVLFHARLAQELAPGEAFGIDDVADDLVAKLVRRHPHVFAGGDSSAVDTLASLNDTWERRKVEEKGRTSVVDGVPLALPALAMTTKLVARARRGGLAAVDVGDVSDAGGAVSDERAGGRASNEDDIGLRLFALAREATLRGVDPESALRRVARRYRAALQSAESNESPASTMLTGPGSSALNHEPDR